MKYAISSESMRLSDENTIKNKGVSGEQLMERASHALFEQVKKENCHNIAIVCGSGNNGGDGYSLALKLLDCNYSVTVYGKIPKTSTAKYYYDKLLVAESAVFVPISEMNDLSCFDIVVDCLLGIGINGQLSEEYVNYITIINTAKFILSCDIASGLNSDNGLKSPIAVKANVTLAIQSFKLGHFLADGKDCSGKLQLCDIGIDIIGKKYYICDDEYVKNSFEQRANNSHKGSFGRCGIVACSKNFVGAGLLAQASAASILSECAMRVGCGYSYLFVPDDMIANMWGRVTHACIFGQSEVGSQKLDSIAFGMGIGDNKKLFDKIADYPCRKVIDADAINILSKNMDMIDKFKGCVLTPHIAEFGRLIGVSIQSILDNPIEYAENFAKKFEVVLLLKGCTTIITDGTNTYLNSSGNSGLAKGGSGDVLSGIIGSMIAQNVPPFTAAVCGSYILGKTAENLAENTAMQSILPMDISKEVGNTLSKIILRK